MTKTEAPIGLTVYDRIVIAGAGDLGREVGSWITGGRLGACNLVWLDDTKPPLQKISDYVPLRGDCLLVAIANPRGRETITRSLLERGANVMALTSPSAVSNGDVTCKYSILLPFSLISMGTTLGIGLLQNTHSSIGHDCVLGDFVTLASGVRLAGRVTVGHRVEFGTGAVVIPGITIGNDAFIGAGAVVVQDVPARARVFGNPARIIGTME